MGSHRPLGTPYNRLTERSTVEGRMAAGAIEIREESTKIKYSALFLSGSGN